MEVTRARNNRPSNRVQKGAEKVGELENSRENFEKNCRDTCWSPPRRLPFASRPLTPVTIVEIANVLIETLCTLVVDFSSLVRRILIWRISRETILWYFFF